MSDYIRKNRCFICCGEYPPRAPALLFKEREICFECYIGIIPKIYKMAGCGDGGLIHLIFNSVVTSSHNRKKRKTISQYKETFEKLLHKYKFMCVYCDSKDELTIDHIHPVSKGGSDDFINLQILCKSCNSKKGNKT